MKKLHFIYSLLIISISTINTQTTIYHQSFESLVSDKWNYELEPETYSTETDSVISGSNDIWAVIREFTGNINNASDGDHFFGTQDLINNDGGGDFFIQLLLKQLTLVTLQT